MIRPSSVGMWLLSCLVVTNTALAKTTSYETAFDLKVLGIGIGQVIVSFEDRLSAGNTTVEVSLTSPSGSTFPQGVSPFSLPVLSPWINVPVYITIKTAVGFRGPAKVGLHLEVLDYNPTLPLRLFVSDGTLASEFNHIPAYYGPGSMLNRG